MDASVGWCSAVASCCGTDRRMLIECQPTTLATHDRNVEFLRPTDARRRVTSETHPPCTLTPDVVRGQPQMIGVTSSTFQGSHHQPWRGVGALFPYPENIGSMGAIAPPSNTSPFPDAFVGTSRPRWPLSQNVENRSRPEIGRAHV